MILDIQVSEEVFDLALYRRLAVITCQLDPGADCALQEGLVPEQVRLKARGTRRRRIAFAIVGKPDVVQKGYNVRDTTGKLVSTMIRNTARVVIGARTVIDKNEENEKPPD